MITVQGIGKTFRVARRSSGIRAALASLLRREYTDIAALRDLSFQIGPGEIVGYIGPNGAGKSTTVKILSGILRPDRGECRIMGRIPWEDRVAHVQNIGVVFGQRTQLWWDVPVLDSFELLRDIYRIPPAEYRRSLTQLTDILDIGPLLQQPVRQLSLGQKMRCELTASLLHRPPILFLDEPTIGLDAVSKLAVRKFIKDMNREKQVTVLLTTHDLADIEALADRIMLLGKGQLLYDGSQESLRRRYGGQKTVTVDYRETEQLTLLTGVEILRQSAVQAVLQVDTGQVAVSRVISQLAGQLDLLDVTVENPPVEELVLRLYEEHQL
ncbi:MAG TPA: ATP-binding cassette domain-containing protein [Patescibacteria group bacterium]|nr:ATP-binding cassette domain-containing protein [Patescibacteria group bacterium]